MTPFFTIIVTALIACAVILGTAYVLGRGLVSLGSVIAGTFKNVRQNEYDRAATLAALQVPDLIAHVGELILSNTAMANQQLQQQLRQLQSQMRPLVQQFVEERVERLFQQFETAFNSLTEHRFESLGSGTWILNVGDVEQIFLRIIPEDSVYSIENDGFAMKIEGDYYMGEPVLFRSDDVSGIAAQLVEYVKSIEALASTDAGATEVPQGEAFASTGGNGADTSPLDETQVDTAGMTATAAADAQA